MSTSPTAPTVLEDPRDAIPRLLARQGYRITAPRRAVLEALATTQEPRTVVPSFTVPSAESASTSSPSIAP